MVNEFFKTRLRLHFEMIGRTLEGISEEVKKSDSEFIPTSLPEYVELQTALKRYHVAAVNYVERSRVDSKTS